MSSETGKALGIEAHHRFNAMHSMQPRTIGPWIVQPFSLEHDVPALGYVIDDGQDRLLFVPDTGFVRNRFSGITIAVLECNHISDLLVENVINGSIPAVVARRIRRSHFSLDQVKDMLRANDVSRLRAVWLIHLSDWNADEARMKKELQELLGVPVYVAQ